VVSSGAYHSCSLTNDGVQCWGHNTYGQLGDGTNIHRHSHVSVIGLGAGVTGIATGGFHSCAVFGTGDVKCWGANFAGQLGDGTTTDQNTPVDVIKLKNVVAIGAGYAHTCALLQSGSIKCWGDNTYGQLGDGTTGNYDTEPVSVSGLVNKVTTISAGGVFTCATMNTGGAKCWGDNFWGELGDGTNTSHPLPADVLGLNAPADSLATGNTWRTLSGHGGTRESSRKCRRLVLPSG
jgi:alpha-tubulin suppressor-like RCC1 family protein